MEGHTPQIQIVDLTGGEVAEIEEAGVPVLAHRDHNGIESGPSGISTSKAAGPITRYAMFTFAGLRLSIMVQLD